MNDSHPSGRPQQPSQQSIHTPQSSRPVPAQPLTDDGLEPLALVEDELDHEPQSATPVKSKIRLSQEVQQKQHQWKRQPFCSGTGAIRVKSFHGKYSDQGLDHMDNVINAWLDEHPGVEVKFVTSTVGVFEGKIREPALVLNVWY